MSDLIERQAAIEAHYEYCNKHPDAGFPVWSLKILEDLPPAQPEKRTEERTETHACDCISRQAAVEAIENTDWYHLRDGVMVRGANSKEHQAWYKEQDVYKTLEQLPSAQQRWIPCSEKLPEANGRYFVTRGLVAAGTLWNRVYIANYSDLMGIKSVKIWWQGNVGKSDFERLDDVLAWMPLPEPYREGK